MTGDTDGKEDIAMNSPYGELIPTPMEFSLSGEHIDVWQSPTLIASEELACFCEVLSEDEHRKADCLRDPAKRIESLVSRGFLRRLLGRALKVDSKAFVFSIGSHGKPYLPEKWQGSSIGFNVSHSRNRLLIAMSLDREVGVDVEWMSPELEWEPLARQYFSASEVVSLANLPKDEQCRGFYRSWVRTEAMLKATGEGFARGLPADTDIQLHTVDLPVGDDYVAAVVSIPSLTSVRFWSPPPGTPGGGLG